MKIVTHALLQITDMDDVTLFIIERRKKFILAHRATCRASGRRLGQRARREYIANTRHRLRECNL